MPQAKIYTKEDIIRAHSATKSNRAAARYLHCSYQHYKKYARLYKDDSTGKTLFELHKNQCGKGIAKFAIKQKAKVMVDDIISGNIDVDSFTPARIREFMILEGYLEEKCACCGFSERRVLDHKLPLLVNFKDNNKRNWTPTNVQMLCYNCFFLRVGDIFTNKQTQGLEDYKPVPETQNVHWEIDEHFIEHFKELNLIEDEPDIGSEFISRPR